MDDLISRQAAIDYCYQLINVEHQQGSDEMNYGQERVNQTETILHHLEMMPSAQPEQPPEIQDILNYLDTVLHPIVSPEHWDVYAELHDMISTLPSAEPKLDKNDMPEQGDSAKFGVITGETCAYWDSESDMCALHRPSAQPEIIHCKECKRQDTDNVFRSMWCHEMRTFVKPNEFCSRADMREEEQDE